MTPPCIDRPVPGWRGFLRALAFVAALGLSCAEAAADAACPDFAPVMYLELDGFYSDARQSVTDAAIERRNLERLRGIDAFMRYAGQALDSRGRQAGEATSPCAYGQFRRWAEAGALTGEPAAFNREGTLKRAQYVVGLNMLALKFKAAGYAIDATILGWLRKLNERNMDYFRRATNRGNLYVWSGAAAALFAILDRDAGALRYQDQVWRDALAAIGDDGAIAGELARGRRALIYHMFSLSATLVLQRARRTLGHADAPGDVARVALLADLIGKALCDPRALEAKAGAAQEAPGDWAYRVPLGYGRELLGPEWARCGRPGAGLSDPVFGGDTAVSAEVLEQLSR